MFLRRQQLIWVLAIVAVLVPYLGLMIIGGYALWEKGWLWGYGAITAGLTAVFYGLALYLKNKRRIEQLEPLKFDCPQDWPPREQAAWQKVERIADLAMRGTIPVKSIKDLQRLLEKLVQEIAQHYHPDQEDAYLNIPLPHLLKIVEKVSRDVREVVQNYLPASHILTLRDWKRIKETYDVVEPLHRIIYTVYRLGTVPISPFNALWREIQRYMTGQAINVTGGQEMR